MYRRRIGVTWINRSALIAVLIAAGVVSPGLAKKPTEPPGGDSASYALVALDARTGYARSLVHDVKMVNGTIMCVGTLDESSENKAVLWEVKPSGSNYDVTTRYLADGEYAVALNTSGEAVGARITFDAQKQLSVYKGLFWADVAGSPIELAPLSGDNATEPSGINAAGVIVGRSIYKYATYDDDGNIEDVFEETTAAAWRTDIVNAKGELVPVDLCHGSGLFSAAHDINECDGVELAQVVGVSVADGGAVHWFVDCASGPLTFTGPELFVVHGNFLHINNSGDVCGRRSGLPFRSLADGTFQELSVPRRATGYANDINEQLQVVGQVWEWNPSGGLSKTYGVLWKTDGKRVELNKFLVNTNWRHIHSGNAITPDGIIAAAGLRDADGESRALLMIPE